MEIFRRRLAALNPLDSSARPEARRWLFVPYDQLTHRLGPLSREDPSTLGIVLVENPWKAARRPYHRQKLALVLANLRHFALEQARRGVAVRHVIIDGPYRDALRPLTEELGPLRMMEAAERELRVDLAPLVADGGLEVLPHEGRLTTPDQFRRAVGEPPWRMDAFYRTVRRESGILMDGKKPVGGKFSFDAENRKPWKGEPPAPEPPRFEPDEIVLEVCELIRKRFARHPGRLDPSTLPATEGQAEHLWQWACRECLEHFGPFEDAMSTQSTGLFHTRIAPLLHLHRLLPNRVVDDALALDLPLASREGFVRQVLGWREFVGHVHRETDGFRRLPTTTAPIAPTPGDGGRRTWSGEDWSTNPSTDEDLDGGARPNFLDADFDLPPAFWGTPSGLHCLDRAVAEVWDAGWTHHIPRLMVLSNLATLLDCDPRQLTDWFWVAFIDAYDWVVEPNVLAMGTFAAGELMTTKPYISGAAYLNKMSDDCGSCRFDPKKNCPVTPLYWAFLDRHRDKLQGNRRLALPLAQSAKRSPDRREEDRRIFEQMRRCLADGEAFLPVP